MKNFMLLVFLFVLNISFSQQVEIALMKEVSIQKYSKKELDRLSEVGHADVKFRNQLFEKIKSTFEKTLLQHIGLLGGNNDIKFVPKYNAFTTNFIIRTSIGFSRDELGLDNNNLGTTFDDGTFVHGIYFVHIHFKIMDPNSNRIVETIDYKFKLKSSGHESSQCIFNHFWHNFVNTGLSKLKADKLAPLLKNRLTYSSAQITYEGKEIADGKTEGKIKISNIKSPVAGEAMQNSITKFRITCEKGTFLETDSKTIEFSGTDYYHNKKGGQGLVELDYKLYDCQEYEDDERGNDIFEIVQVQVMSHEIENEVKTEIIDFKCEDKYDIVVTYTAPGFAKATLLWANTTIRFPDEGKPVQQFNMMAYKTSGAMEEPTGSDGEPLSIPYATVIPGIGLQTLYGWPENESAIPEVIFVASLGGHKVFSKFKVNLDEDALNTCNISKDNNGPIYLDLNFDLTGKYSNSDVWQQVDVGCKEDKEWNITKGNSLNGYPLAFKQVKFTDVDIEKFKKAEGFEKTLSNGRATLKIEFKIVK